MFNSIRVVLQDIVKSKNLTQMSEADEIYDAMTSVEIVFILHFLIEKFRELGWDPLFEKVKLFCKDHEIEVSNLSALYKAGRDIYMLMNNFYPDDFTKQEKLHMKIHLEHFQLDAHQNTELQKASTVAELCQALAKTNKLSIDPLPNRIIRLVLTSSYVYCNNQTSIFSHENCEDKAPQ
ncbi:hypothetical protein J1N35_018748 [Gossypium stocksii]|uniref:Uncharacterized protein n=1 Tax=Gossypium stocksii TaxID=47602 RepID=A0A9D3VPP2_9ROSI|nr:hypothetical protein J1N35_018748 [Gossypium stocksii]